MLGRAGAAKERAVARRDSTAQHVAAAAPAWLDRRLNGYVKAGAGIKAREFGSDGKTRIGNRPQPAPRGVAWLKHLLDQLARYEIAICIDAAAVGVVDRRPVLDNHLDQHADALQNIDRLKSRDHARGIELVDQKAKGRQARDGSDVTRQDKAVDGRLGVVGDRTQSRRRGLVSTVDREVLEPASVGLQDSGGNGGRCGLKADAHKDDRAFGILLGNVECVERRVDDADVAPRRLLRGKRGGRSGHAHHVAKGGDDGAVHVGKRDCVIDVAVGGDANGAPRAAEQFESRRHNGAKAIAANAHGLRTADFHKVDDAVADKLMNTIDELASQLGVAKCRKVDTGANRLRRRH